MFENIAKIINRKTRMSNGGWDYDTHKYLEPLDSGKTIEIANIKGPAIIKSIMTTKHDVFTTDGRKKKIVSNTSSLNNCQENSF